MVEVVTMMMMMTTMSTTVYVFGFTNKTQSKALIFKNQQKRGQAPPRHPPFEKRQEAHITKYCGKEKVMAIDNNITTTTTTTTLIKN